MKILATDMDRTLLPNGSWEGDENAINLFNELTRKHGVLVVYVTGRNLALTEGAVKEFGVRPPDILIGDVGTTIRKFEHGQWQFDEGWTAHVRRVSPRWDAEAIKAAVAAQGVVAVTAVDEVVAGPAQDHVGPRTAGQKVIAVAADQSASDALIAAGVHVDIKCSDGICGVCKCGVTSGSIEHRDFVLSKAQREGAMILCQSRAAKGAEIAIDF